MILFALLLAVSLLGVGRLFQIRVDFEDETSRYFQLELETERLRLGLHPRAGRRRARRSPAQPPSAAELQQAAKSFAEAADRAADLTGADTVLTGSLERLVARRAGLAAGRGGARSCRAAARPPPCSGGSRTR